MRAAILFVLIGLLLALAWFAFRRSDLPSLDARPQAPIAAAPLAAAAADPAPLSPTAVDQRGLAPEPAADQPQLPADARFVEILVVERGTELPVAGADAVWSDGSEGDRVMALPPRERAASFADRERIAGKWGWRGRSDRDGKLRVHVGQYATSVFVRSAGRYGEGVFAAATQPPPGGHRLVIEPEVVLHVRVVDGLGASAAGVPLQLEKLDPDHAATERDSQGGDAITDADGVAVFVHLQKERTWSGGPRRGEPVRQWRVRTRLPGITVTTIAVDAQAPPTEPLELRLPPTGRLKLRATFAGEPIPGDDGLALHAGPRGDIDARNGALRGWLDPDGWVRYPHVPLDRPLFAIAQRHGSWEHEVQGPTRAGQEVTAEIDVGALCVVLTGRIFAVDGQPLANSIALVEFRVDNGGGNMVVHTDAVGRFLWPVRQLPPDREVNSRLQGLRFEHRRVDAPIASVEVLPRDLVRGRNELGELRLAVAAAVVSGRFVFDTPGPSSAGFEIQRHRAFEAGGRSIEQWERVRDLQVDLREDGAFVVRGKAEPGRYRLFLPGEGHLPVDPVEFPLGATDLVVAIRRGHQLKVSCRLPTGIEARCVNLRLQPAAATADDVAAGAPAGRGDPLRARGWDGEAGPTSYQWAALVAGSYTLVVEVPGYAEPFAVVRDVVVPTPAAGDPRLAELDLREVMGALGLRIEVDGPDYTMVYVMPQPQPAERDWTGITLRPGEYVLPVPKRPVDLLVAADGMRPQSLAAASGRAAVRLSAWPTVDVRVVGAESLPPGASLRIGCVPATQLEVGDRSFRNEWGAHQLDDLVCVPSRSVPVANGVASLPIGDGVMRLQVFLSPGANARAVALARFTPSEIVGGAPVTLTLSADELRSVLATQPPAAEGR